MAPGVAFQEMPVLVDPSIASGIARLSLLFVSIAGFALVIYLIYRRIGRALV